MAPWTNSSRWSKMHYHASPALPVQYNDIFAMTEFGLPGTPKRSQLEYNTTMNPKVLHSISITFSSTCPQKHSKKHFKWLVNDSNHLCISVQHISLRLCLNQACCFCIAVPLCWTTPRHALLCSPGHAGTLIHLECHLLDMLVRHRVRFSNDSKQLNKTLPALLELILDLRW